MGLNQRDHAVILRLRRENVEQTLAGLNQFMGAASWLGQGNRYSIDTIATLRSEKRLQNPRQLSEYIAASCLLHCSDGWSYLGRALFALLRGDPHRALHLAYYAELRAAASLMATEGIGIFNGKHFAITAPNVATEMYTKSGTHEFSWDCLKFWASQGPSGNLFAQLIRPSGISLENWFTPIGGAIVVAPQAQAWFQQWGMDLRLLADDRKARNVSSYQPDGIPTTWTVDTHETIDFIRNLWEALEPSPLCRFEALDRHILRLSLEAAFRGQQGKEPSKAEIKFKQFVEQVVQHQGLSTEISLQWLKFLTREVVPTDPDIFSFSQQPPQNFANSHCAIISRAVLLLRAASGSTMRLFQTVGHSIETFEFWWDGIGQTRGLWDGKRDVSGLQDLWIDIRDSLSEIEAFQLQNKPKDQTFFRLGREIGHTLIGLSSCERVALWSMAP